MKGDCLVTGGAGFIGCAISEELCAAFDKVVVLDCMHPQIHLSGDRPAALCALAELVRGDVANRDVWDELLGRVRPETIVHLAAETGTGQSLTEGTRHATVNVVGTTQMLDAFVRHDCLPKRIILTSSRAVYGEGAWRDAAGALVYPGQRSLKQLSAGIWDFPELTHLPFEALRTAPHPTSIYGATKLAQELIVAAWALSFNVDHTVLRLQNVYGPGQSLNNPYTGIVSLFAKIARSGGTIPLYEDGKIIRDFVYIDDVADAVCRVATRSFPPRAAYDIGSGIQTTIGRLASIIAEIYAAPPPVVNGAFRNGDVRAASCDIDPARTILGWEPQWTLDRGIASLCAWIERQSLAGAGGHEPVQKASSGSPLTDE
jgi:dTDP-L-rhamnose 4-epimerase